MTGPPFREVVVPLDLVVPADNVLAIASTLARRAGVGLRLVTVSSPGMDHGRDRYELQAHAATVDAPSVTVDIVESNDVAPALLAAAGADGLLVVETRARGPVAAIVLGSTASALLHAADRPVLLVGPAAQPGLPLEVMAVAIDTADAAATLAPVAAGWSQALRLQVRFVHVHTDAPADGADTPAHAAARLARADFGVSAEAVSIPARGTAAAIVADAAAAGAAIVAVGTRARPRRLPPLGSVALAVAHTAGAAVLAVPLAAGGGVRHGRS